MTARDEVLGRIRGALGGTGAAPGAIPRDYRSAAGMGPAEVLDRLSERLRDYGCRVYRVTAGEVPGTVAAALAERGARRVVVPPGLEPRWLPSPPPGTEFITDDGLSPAALDSLDGVITGAALAIAETGTIVLDAGPGQGRRVLSLIPDYHLCLLRAGQVAGLVPEAIARLRPGQPLTWISGPSATADIELSRVEGVHGPRTLDVILVADA
ncbi:MAG: LUD domain-containing protein [Nocardiopsaceae bacterium]|nr:LUD domain-containing protein [Nocardiopsaceae bacterium]